MAVKPGIKPLFASAPRVAIKVADVTIAYGIGVNLNVSVDVRPVMVLGSYMPSAYEPVMFGVVNGSIQIVKQLTDTYQKAIAIAAAAQAVKDASEKLESLVQSDKTTPAQLTKARVFLASALQDQASLVAQTDNNILRLADASKNLLENHLDPLRVLLSQTFDLEITLAQEVGLNLPMFTIKDCRLSGRSVNVAMGQLTNEAFTYQGLLVVGSDDAAEADVK